MNDLTQLNPTAYKSSSDTEFANMKKGPYSSMENAKFEKMKILASFSGLVINQGSVLGNANFDSRSSYSRNIRFCFL